MNRTKIDWSCFPQPLLTVNPFIGCSHASEGCQNCYAEAMARRQVMMGNKHYGEVVELDLNSQWEISPTGWNGKTLFLPDRLESVRKRKGGGTVFINSMSDLFHENNSFDHIRDVWATMVERSRNLTHVVLTKRPARMKQFIEWLTNEVKHPLVPPPCNAIANLYLGVTAENQARADERIPILLSIHGKHKTFVSVEPMLEEIRIGNFLWQTFDTGGQRGDGSWIQDREPSRELDLIIIGAETGTHKRPCKREWVVDLQKQCADAGVQCYLKDTARKLAEGGGE